MNLTASRSLKHLRPPQVRAVLAGLLWAVLPLAASDLAEPPQEPLPAALPSPLERSLEAEESPREVISEAELDAMVEQVLGPDRTGPVEVLRPQEAIDIALNRNLGLVIARYEPGIAYDRVVQAESTFDPVVFSRARARTRLSPQAASDLEGVAAGVQPRSSSEDGEIGVSKRLPTGGTVSTSTGIVRGTSNSARAFLNPDYTSEVNLRVSQPLLRDFGPTVNLAEVAKARLAHNQSRLAVRREVLDVVAETEIRYWNLSAARARKALFESNLALAESLLRENRERERLGLATRLDVLQAEASLAARSEDVILAQQQVENAEDRLRTILGDLNYEPSEALEVEMLPEIDPEVPAFRAAVRSALAQSMDLQIQLEVLEQRRIDRAVARDQLDPSLNLTAGVSALGRAGLPEISYRNTGQLSGYQWDTGLELSFPWGLRSARAQVQTTRRQVDRETTRLAEIQQTLLLRLREAWRAVVAGRERMVTTGASLTLNEESFVRERARYDAGASTFRNVLEAQRDFDAAKIRHLDAMADLIRATIFLSRLDGTILERHAFTWEEIDDLTGRPPEPVEPLGVDFHR